MKLILGTSWKTTLFGIAIGAALILQTALESGEIDWGKVCVAVLIMALGRFAKDATASGKGV